MSTAGPLDRDRFESELGSLLGLRLQILEVRGDPGRLESLTVRILGPEGASLDMDVAHVDTFEKSTWEPAPADRASLVGSRSHTMHSRDGKVSFRLATWVDSFAAHRVAQAIRSRLELAAEEPR